MLASGAFMRFRASGLNAVLSFGVVFRISISRFDDGPLSRDCLVGELGFMRLSVLQGRCGEACSAWVLWRSSPEIVRGRGGVP